MLSWFVDGQLVAKRGNLMQIGGQEGIKLKLRGALGRPKRPKEGLQWHDTDRICCERAGTGLSNGGPGAALSILLS